MNSLCKYKDYLGKPDQGVHSYRFGGVAIIDVIMTILGAFLISRYGGYSFAITLGSLFVLGVFMHRLFCVRTTIDRILFSSE